jgi:hypothetical protein
MEVERWLAPPGRVAAVRNVALSLGEAGISTSRGSGAGKGRLALPAPVDAHHQGNGIRTLDFGWPDDALEPWIAGMGLGDGIGRRPLLGDRRVARDHCRDAAPFAIGQDAAQGFRAAVDPGRSVEQRA